MHLYNDILIVSLGSSCPIEAAVELFAIDAKIGMQSKSGIFDWVIISPASIIQFLKYYKDKPEFKKITLQDSYELVDGSDGNTYPKNKFFECFYIWHFDQYSNNFEEKSKHKIDTLINHKGKKIFLLSNDAIQIKDCMNTVNDDYNKFIITYDQYIELQQLIAEIFPESEIIINTSKELSRGFPEDFKFNYGVPQPHQLKEILGLDLSIN